jgi:hypothetical protein
MPAKNSVTKWVRDASPPVSWSAFVSAISEAREDLGFLEFEECFYRGQSRVTDALLPSLLRQLRGRAYEEVMAIESDLFHEFQARSRELHQLALTDWDVLQFMRHHRVATRLLDWTETLAIAVYFAIANLKADSTPCVWLLNPYALNVATGFGRDLVAPKNLGWDHDEQDFYDYGDLLLEQAMDFETPVALYPIQKSARLAAQRGYFTIHGDSHDPLEEVFPAVLRVVQIHPNVVSEAREFLSLAGLDEHVLFPDLDGLQRYLHAKYNLR